MYKKSISLFCALSIVLSFAACSGGQVDSESTVPQTSEPTVQTAPTEATEATVPAAFQQIVIVDNESCTFTITGIEEDAIFGYTLKAFLENKTDLELMFSLTDVSVNGFMCDPFWAASVISGMKANESITFSDFDFERNGITEVTDITFTLRIYDSNDWMADAIVEDTFTIYPMGEDAVKPYERAAQEGETVLFDSEECTMIVTGFDPDDPYGHTVNVYLENKTGKTLTFSASDVSVNGFMCDPYWAVTVAPGKRSNTSITWMEDSFADNGISEVESILLPIRVYDSNDLIADDLLSETFTLNP